MLPDYIVISSPMTEKLFKEMSVEPICRNCRFWARVDLAYSKHGRCSNDKVDEQVSENEGLLPIFPENFGCIHFEIKDPATD